MRANGAELMSTRRSHSEAELAAHACGPLAFMSQAQVLIGGLGFGFTLRAALGFLAPDANVLVAELLPEVIAWNRNPDYALGGDVVADPRVTVVQADVHDVLRSNTASFDGIMLDVDNGADAFTTSGNASLYESAGIAATVDALRPGGRVAWWSAHEDPGFVRALRRAGLQVATHRSRTHTTSKTRHSIIVAHR